jgi:hypothetical protein
MAPIYTGRFTADQIAPVLAAAAPIPNDVVEDEDISLGLGAKRLMPRKEAIVRRLEEINGLAEIQVELKKKNAPAAHAKSLYAIEAAAIKLLEALGTGSRGDVEVIPRQIWNSLRSKAELQPSRMQSGDYLLRDDIASVVRIADWAQKAKEQELRGPYRSHHSLVEANLAKAEDHFGGDPINNALRDVLRIWTDILSRKIATSSTTSTGGPLIRFSEACLLLIFEKPPGPTAIRNRIRRIATGTSPKPRGRRRKARTIVAGI